MANTIAVEPQRGRYIYNEIQGVPLRAERPNQVCLRPSTPFPQIPTCFPALLLYNH